MSGPVIGNYRVERRLGSGTFATVWLGWDPDLERHVAIKVLADNWSADEDIRRRFLQEAKILWRLDHPRIVRVFLTGTLPDGRPYFVMEYADGGSLHERIQARKAEKKPYSIKEAVEISSDIADGLIVAHARGIIHRDLKPSNVLFTKARLIGRESVGEKERLMLADFGIARQLERATHMTITAGTPYYMSPEQANPQPGIGPNQQSDVYSAATVLYELLTGDVPYPFESISQIVRAQERGERQPIRSIRPDVPEQLAHVIDTGLETSLAQRFSSAREWKDAIAPFASDTGVVVPRIQADQPTLDPDRLAQQQKENRDSNRNEKRNVPVRLAWHQLPAVRYTFGVGVALLLTIGLWRVVLRSSSSNPTPTPGDTTPVPTQTLSANTPTPTIVSTQTDLTPTVNNNGIFGNTTPTPATDPAVQRLEQNFAFITPDHCSMGSLQPNTDAVVTCHDTNVTVTYQEYTSAIALQGIVNTYESLYKPKVTTWQFGSASNAPTQGTLLQFLNANGQAVLVWTLDSQNMSGTAVSANGDQSALHQWWIDVGGVRPGS